MLPGASAHELRRWDPPRGIRAGAALAGGLLMAAAFPPLGWWWASILSVALLAASTFGQRLGWAALYGAIAGLAFFGLLLQWMMIVGADAWVALTVLCALWWAGLFIAQSLVQHLRWWPVWVACLWVASESLRGSLPLGGFPWGRLAHAQVTGPLLPFAAVVGAAGVTFVVALAGCLAFEAVRRAVRGDRTVLVLTPVLMAGVVLAGWAAAPSPAGGATTITIAAVQGGVPGEGLSAMGERRAVLANHVRLTRGLASARPEGVDLVIWPENATDIDPFRDAAARAAIDGAVAAVGVPVLVGAVVEAAGDPTRVANSGIMWEPGLGPTQTYVKQHPVPFGEYIPMRDVLGSWVDRFRLVPRDFIAGGRAGVLDVAGVTIGDVICFEVAYDSIMRDVVRAGAQLLVVQTNNATYGGTAQPGQQVAMSQLRAVEFGRPVVVAATSGISAVIDVDGSVRASLGDGESGVLVEAVTTQTDSTMAARFGEWLQGAIVVAGALGLAYAANTVIRSRRTP